MLYVFTPGRALSIARMPYLSSINHFRVICVPPALEINCLCLYAWVGFQYWAHAVLEQHVPLWNNLGSIGFGDQSSVYAWAFSQHCAHAVPEQPEPG